MHVVDTHVTSDGALVEEVREVRGPQALLAALLRELGTTHPERECHETFCFISPPRWAWRLGPTWRLNLGAVVFRVGQWAERHHGELVRTRPVGDDDEVAVAQWGAGGVEECRRAWRDDD